MKAQFSRTLVKEKWLIGLLVALLLFTWPLVLHPIDLMGHVQGEASNHLWMFWRAGIEGPVSNFPEGLGIPLMDPVNLPVYRFFSWIHPALGFNAVWVFNLLLAFVGASFLARTLGVSRGASFSAGVACAFSPLLSGLGSFGITEAWPIGWLGLHFAFMIRFSETGRKRSLVFSSLTLAAFLFSGWYSAFFAAVAEPLLLLFLWRRGSSVFPLLLQAGVAGLLVLPRFLAFLSQRDLWSDRWRSVPVAAETQWEAWRELPRSGADALNLVLPSFGTVPVSKSVYLGLVLLFLVYAAGRKARWLWIWSTPFILLGLGTALSIGGHQSLGGFSLSLPAAWLQSLFPPLEGLTHWYRALAPATLFLAVAAAMGVDQLSKKRPVWLFAAPALLLVDSLVFSQTPWPRSQVSVESPAIYEGISGGGALLQIPLHNGRREFTEDEPRVYNRWQPAHGFAVAENYEGDDSILEKNRLVRELQDLCVPRSQGAAVVLSVEERKMWLRELKKQGFGHLVVHGVGSRPYMDAWQCGAPGASREERSAVVRRIEVLLEPIVGQPVLSVGGDLRFRIRDHNKPRSNAQD